MDLPELFEQFSLDSITGYIDCGQEEHLLLDFKTITKADLSNSDDKRNLAKALSGFANSSGGIIVWGVDARKRKPDGPDVAVGKKVIEPLGLFLSKLNEFTGAFVRPLVDGVRHRTLETSPDRGFAITIVPESDVGPHMALGGEGRYHKRSGASFYPMEHFDIADMFGRRKRPVLTLVASVGIEGTSSGAGGPEEYNVKITLSLTNTGRGSAKFAYVGLRVAAPYSIDFYGLDGNRNEGMPRLYGPSAHERRYAADAGLVLHPNTSLGITAIRLKVKRGQSSLPDLRIEYETAAEDLALQSGVLSVPGSEILASVQRYCGHSRHA